MSAKVQVPTSFFFSGSRESCSSLSPTPDNLIGNNAWPSVSYTFCHPGFLSGSSSSKKCLNMRFFFFNCQNWLFMHYFPNTRLITQLLFFCFPSETSKPLSISTLLQMPGFSKFLSEQNWRVELSQILPSATCFSALPQRETENMLYM